MFVSPFESDAEEAARLAQSPSDSRTYFLSTLPVTIREHVRGLIIRLPREFPENGEIVVVPVECRLAHRERAEGEKLRHDGSWTCIVVHSTDSRYQVGGYDIIVGEESLRRGTRVVPA